MSARPALRGAALLATALVVTSCGSGDESGSEAESSGTASAASEAFPVTVSTAFGDVTIEEEPTRVVALGWSDAETALALGVEPVGASDWLAVGGNGLGDWVEQGYTEEPEMIETLEPSFEAIAALEPDLILDTRSSATQERYDLLSEIAPTIGQPEGVGPYQTTWQQQLDLVGQALGRTDEAAALEAEVEQAFTDAAEANPGFQGTEVAVGAYTSEGFGAYVSGDARVAFMEQLGFRNKQAIEDQATENFFIPVSEEQLDLLDAELTVVFPIFVEASEFTGNPLWQALPSVQEGRAVVLDDTTTLNAFSSASAPGLLYALDTVVPQFADALGG